MSLHVGSFGLLIVLAIVAICDLYVHPIPEAPTVEELITKSVDRLNDEAMRRFILP